MGTLPVYQGAFLHSPHFRPHLEKEMTLLLVLAAVQFADLGQPLPPFQGDDLTGKATSLPVAAKGKIALYALGFSYDSRFPVEAWVARFEKDFARRDGLTFYEVPVIGGLGMLGRPFIDRGMRRGTPAEKHQNVVTVYGGAGSLRKAFRVKDDKQAVLVLTDRAGIVRWRHEGPFDEAKYEELRQALERLLR
jgi:hypothetical protein